MWELPWLLIPACLSFHLPEAQRLAGPGCLRRICIIIVFMTLVVCRSVGATVGKRLGRTILELGELASSSVEPKVLQ